jgi:ATP-dependent DNA ligase
MNKKQAYEYLGDFVVEDILTMTDEEVANEFNNLGIDQAATVRLIRQKTDSASLEYRKSKLKKAKAAFSKAADEQRHQTLLSALKSSGEDVRDYLARLLTTGKIPQEITMAFRDGKEISEDEALSIMEDLIELGILKDDESQNPK